MNIGQNIKEILSELPEGVQLIAVSKFHPQEAIMEAYECGQRIFGESKVQELTEKYEARVSKNFISEILRSFVSL